MILIRVLAVEGLLAGNAGLFEGSLGGGGGRRGLDSEDFLVKCWERNGGQGGNTALHIIQASQVSIVMYVMDMGR